MVIKLNDSPLWMLNNNNSVSPKQRCQSNLSYKCVLEKGNKQRIYYFYLFYYLSNTNSVHRNFESWRANVLSSANPWIRKSDPGGRERNDFHGEFQTTGQ